MCHRRILIVDDDEVVLNVLSSSFKYLLPDYQVVAVGDGRAALVTLQQQAFDLILTDYNMPHLNGLELARAIHQILPNIPIVLMTAGYMSDEIQPKTGSVTLAGFLAKPFSIPQLREILQQNGI